MRLLFVEDEPDLREVLKKQLQGSGYSVDACGDGLEALDYLQLTAYDAVILDIMLPGVDGLSVLKKMRNAGDKTPVLLLTARGSVEDRVAGLDLGADDYLVKPFAFDELVARLRVLLRRSNGQVSNVLLALVFLFLYGLLYRALYSVQFLLDMIWLTAYISLALAIFNIIPVLSLVHI